MEWAARWSGVEHSFGKIVALSGLSMEVPCGRISTLLGPNGSGKTTAIRALLGLLRPQRGSIEVLGGVPQDPKVRRKIGYMPQEIALFGDLSVEENLRVFGKLEGLSGSWLQKRVEWALEVFDLSGRRSDLVSTLSGGMSRRASLAVALLHDPELLVLDEPTVGVDPVLRRSFWEMFQELAREGKTLLVTTHYMDEARLSHEVYFLRDGRLLSHGSPSQLTREAGVKEHDLEGAFLKMVQRKEGG